MHISLDISRDGTGHLAGTVQGQDGAGTEFSGIVELVTAVEHLLDVGTSSSRDATARGCRSPDRR